MPDTPEPTTFETQQCPPGTVLMPYGECLPLEEPPPEQSTAPEPT